MNSNIFSLMKQYGIKPSKKLGQNFLVDENISNKIISQCGNVKGKTILEIGPGVGSLTNQLVTTDAEAIYAVEYDKTCLPCLNAISALYTNKLNIIHADALKFDEELLVKDSKIIIISNLPYNISTTLLFKWLKKPYLFEKFILMFQKEVADRITSKPNSKSYGVISVLTQYLCNVYHGFDVPPESFYPVPKVHSSVIAIEPKENTRERLKLYPYLREVCKSLFNHRRKMIRSSLKNITKNSIDIMKFTNLEPTLRPENLTVKDFISLTKAIYNI